MKNLTQPIKKDAFQVVLEALVTSAQQLVNQDKDAAKKTIVAISDKIHRLNALSLKKEADYKELNEKITDAVAKILDMETASRERCLEVQKSIDELNIQIRKEETDKDALIEHIETMQTILIQAEAELRMHQAKLDELNDTSAGSIFISIFTLGLDRAIKGVISLVNEDASKIKSLKDELVTYRAAIERETCEKTNHESVLKQLYEKKRSSESMVAQLENIESHLHNNEKVSRQGLGYVVNVALFYSKLLVISQDVDHKIDQVADIVAELNDRTPTIIDFDSSGEDCISLMQALERFDEFQARKPARKMY